MIVTHDDAKAFGYCNAGLRKWFPRDGVTFDEFRQHGVTAEWLRATGDAIYPVVASVGSFALVLGVGSYFLGHAVGLPGIFIAYAADEWVRGLLVFVRWRRHGWVPHARNAQRRVRRG